MQESEFKERLAAVDARMRERLGHPDYAAKRDALAAHIDQRLVDERERAKMERRKRARIPEGLWGYLDDPEPTPALTFVAKWLGGHEAFGLLSGTVGTGKTIALGYAADQPGGRFSEAFDLVRLDLWGEEWNDLVRAPVLGVDELGMEPLDQGGWGESKFCDLLNARLNAGHRTLLATNLGPREFWARYPDARLRDRIQSSCRAEVFSGPSMRGQP